MCYEVVAAIALERARQGYPMGSLVCLLCDDAYLLGQDWRQSRGRDIAVADAGVSLPFEVRERGEKVKTWSNQGVIIDTEFLKFVLAATQDEMDDLDLVFPMCGPTFRRLFREAAEARGLGFVGPPHNQRDSRPARDAFLNKRSLEQIRRRGRWALVKSVERYSKEHWLIRHRALVPADVMEEGKVFVSSPERVWGAAILQGQGDKPSKIAQVILRALSDSTACGDFTNRHMPVIRSPRLGRVETIPPLSGDALMWPLPKTAVTPFSGPSRLCLL